MNNQLDRVDREGTFSLPTSLVKYPPPDIAPQMKLVRLALTILLALTLSIAAQAFFEQFFQEGQRGEEHREESSGTDRPANGDCLGYLCKDTKICVDFPKDCPCKNALYRKCMIGADHFVCVRGGSECPVT
ncbi:hypothetical protein M427DRAFT_356082 [Gonapodya prolifera JEL478]|uniref:Long chronological lifespan protein 2 n=1 Tax=Gonapodya prolifera (strain JEL478) TaxID=1344416 RepID=A0A139AB26_GONPJ|nr:hypothetical protein M427DRAFT_356082 [Gonapodya prolifera JEL478]|eukprot:KXS13950.1 hypothetical protein M427DRAFT_356082 [Gonapodya prolifera JEL478]